MPTHYTGHKGDEIGIIVTDDFMVKYVHVSIATPEGEDIESGEATQQTGLLWGYTATQNNENSNGCRIQITASDLPGNITTEEAVK